MLLALQRATHRTLQALAAELGDLKLSASETNVLANLADGRARNVRELSLDTGTRATTLTGILDRLEQRELVTRTLDPADRRSFRIALSEQGAAAATTVRAAVDALETHALAGLPAADLAGFHAVVTALQEVF